MPTDKLPMGWVYKEFYELFRDKKAYKKTVPANITAEDIKPGCYDPVEGKVNEFLRTGKTYFDDMDYYYTQIGGCSKKKRPLKNKNKNKNQNPNENKNKNKNKNKNISNDETTDNVIRKTKKKEPISAEMRILKQIKCQIVCLFFFVFAFPIICQLCIVQGT